MERMTVQNKYGFLFSPGDRVRDAMFRDDKGTVLEVRLSGVVRVEWDTPHGENWYVADVLEPIEAP